MQISLSSSSELSVITAESLASMGPWMTPEEILLAHGLPSNVSMAVSLGVKLHKMGRVKIKIKERGRVLNMWLTHGDAEGWNNQAVRGSRLAKVG